LGLVTVLSFNRWSNLRLPSSFGSLGSKPPFELLDYVTLHIMVPVSATLVAIFVAWRVVPSASRSELGLKSELTFQGWLWMLRVAVPLALLSILFL
jgi:NSS family neurotransmitter:Na+ symporter